MRTEGMIVLSKFYEIECVVSEMSRKTVSSGQYIEGVNVILKITGKY